jgi:hypothetical protein
MQCSKKGGDTVRTHVESLVVSKHYILLSKKKFVLKIYFLTPQQTHNLSTTKPTFLTLLREIFDAYCGKRT